MKSRLIFLISLLLCFFSCREKNSICKVTIIPEPQVVNKTKGNFIIPEVIKFYSDKKNYERSFTIDQLNEEWNNKIEFSDKPEIANVVLSIIGNDNSDLVKQKEQIGEQGYSLRINEDKIMIFANSETGIFYGVQSLKQLLRASVKSNSLACIEIIDWPGLEYRGWQDDISRGPIPTMEFMKKQIQIMAEYKQNIFTLYTEHVFKLKKHPNIAPDDGITAEEIVELVNFAKKYHIEVIGNFQSFGHFDKILTLPEYKHLAETEKGWILSPAFEESYEFLNDAFQELAPVYSSKFFNINCDETWGLGEGASKEIVEEIGVEGLYAQHINRIDNLLKPLDKRIMMWGDIAVKHKEIIDALPKDLIVLSWGYGPEESFDKVIIPFKETGFDFMVCPGVGCWSKIWPEYHSGIINISNYIRDGYHHGAMGVLNTTWDDDGENLYNYNWYPLLWGAECGWKPVSYQDKDGKEIKKRLQRFNKKFSPLFFESPDEKLTSLLIRLSEMGKFSSSRNLSNNRFWKSISKTIMEKHNEEEKVENQELLVQIGEIIGGLNKFKNAILKNKEVLDYAIFAAERIKLIAERELLGIRISESLFSENLNMEVFKNDLKILTDKALDLKNDYKILWNQENRIWWLDTNLAKFDALAEDLQKSYLNVTINPAISQGLVKIELKKLFNDGDIYYTLDGSTPNSNSIKYTKPFVINGQTTISAIGWLNGNPGRLTQKSINPHLALGKQITLKDNYHPNYTGGGSDGLVNGVFASDNFKDGKWQGFEFASLEAVIDLGEITKVSEINTRFLQQSGSWIFQPVKIEFLISDDDTNFESIKMFTNDIEIVDHLSIIKNYSVKVNQNTRYIKVIAQNNGHCPKWHAGETGKAWIFVDEIVVK